MYIGESGNIFPDIQSVDEFSSINKIQKLLPCIKHKKFIDIIGRIYDLNTKTNFCILTDLTGSIKAYIPDSNIEDGTVISIRGEIHWTNKKETFIVSKVIFIEPINDYVAILHNQQAAEDEIEGVINYQLLCDEEFELLAEKY